MEPLDPKLRQLIDEGLPAAMPDAEAQRRGLAALLEQIDAPPPTADIPPAATGTGGLTKLLLVVATLGTAGTVGWAATRPETPAPSTPITAPVERDEPPAAPPRTPTPPPATPQPATTPATPVAEPATRRKTQPSKAPPSAPAPSTTVADALRAEADLIARAESALDRDKPREALALCDFHRKGFDTPQLTTERQAIAASARCMIDDNDTASARTFVSAHPRSPLAKKVRQRCSLTAGEEKTTPR